MQSETIWRKWIAAVWKCCYSSDACVSSSKIFDSPQSLHNVRAFNVFHHFLIAFSFITLSPLLFGHFPIKYCSEQVCYTFSVVLPLLLFYYPFQENGQKTKEKKHRILDHMKCSIIPPFCRCALNCRNSINECMLSFCCFLWRLLVCVYLTPSYKKYL